MSSFLEWRTENGVKVPWLITNETHTMAAAALWDVWEGEQPPLLSCTIITTNAAPEFAPWHSRMPVMLAEAELCRWMDNNHPVHVYDPVFRPELKYSLYLSPLDKSASNARNKKAEVKADFRNANILKDGRAVFNIAGNKYRLVVWINYEYRVVYIRFIGTHREYDHIDVQTMWCLR